MQTRLHKIGYNMSVADITMYAVLVRQLNNIKRDRPDEQVEVVVIVDCEHTMKSAEFA